MSEYDKRSEQLREALGEATAKVFKEPIVSAASWPETKERMGIAELFVIAAMETVGPLLAAPVPQSGGEARPSYAPRECWKCRCLTSVHHGPGIGCEGAGGNCGCDLTRAQAEAGPTPDRGAGASEQQPSDLKGLLFNALTRYRPFGQKYIFSKRMAATQALITALNDWEVGAQPVEQRGLRMRLKRFLAEGFVALCVPETEALDEMVKAAAPQPKEAELRAKMQELVASWRKQANYSMQNSTEREMHVAAAAELVCADVLEAALATRHAQGEDVAGKEAHEHAMELRARLLALLPAVHTQQQLDEVDAIVASYGGSR